LARESSLSKARFADMASGAPVEEWLVKCRNWLAWSQNTVAAKKVVFVGEPLVCGTSPGVFLSNWSTETQSPGGKWPDEHRGLGQEASYFVSNPERAKASLDGPNDSLVVAATELQLNYQFWRWMPRVSI
jgi:hypothetical protein